MSAPWLKFYPSDWRADPALRMCSVAARGLWMEMLCLMHEASPRGSLLVNGRAIGDKQIAALAGMPAKDAAPLIAELEDAGVFSRECDGTIYSRRMRRDDEKAARDKTNGRKGGNPKVKGGVNPPGNPPRNPTPNGGDKAQKPEARITEANASGGEPPSADPSIEKRDLYDRGKAVLGPKAGGVISNLLTAKGGNVALARAAIEQASQAQNPHEYVGRIVKPKPGGQDNASSVVSAGQRLIERMGQADRLRPDGGGSGGGHDVRLLAQSGRH